MFETRKSQIRAYKFATLTNEEAQLIFDVLDVAELALERIAPQRGAFPKTADEVLASEALDKMFFIEKRPLTDKKGI
jgi:hypothetical protein